MYLVKKITTLLEIKPTEYPLDKQIYFNYALSIIRRLNDKDINLGMLCNNLALICRDLGNFGLMNEVATKAYSIFQAFDKQYLYEKSKEVG